MHLTKYLVLGQLACYTTLVSALTSGYIGLDKSAFWVAVFAMAIYGALSSMIERARINQELRELQEATCSFMRDLDTYQSFAEQTRKFDNSPKEA